MKLDGKTALVTGGAVRVGRAISLALASEGMRLVVHYNSSSTEADSLVDEIRAGGGEAKAIGADLGSLDAVESLAREAESAFGGIDVLINNASVFPDAAFADVDAATWESAIAINLRAPFFLTQHLGAAMRGRGHGVVVNIADLAGIQSWSGYAAHAISKAGVVHLTKVSARALGPEVRVNAIAPGTVLPPEGTPDEEVRWLAERSALKRNGSPEDVAGAVVFLAGADFITGELLVVDGGRLLK